MVRKTEPNDHGGESFSQRKCRAPEPWNLTWMPSKNDAFCCCHQTHYSLWEWPCKVQSSKLSITHCCFRSRSINHQLNHKLHTQLSHVPPSSASSTPECCVWASALPPCKPGAACWPHAGPRAGCGWKAPHSGSGSSHPCHQGTPNCHGLYFHRWISFWFCFLVLLTVNNPLSTLTDSLWISATCWFPGSQLYLFLSVFPSVTICLHKLTIIVSFGFSIVHSILYPCDS